MLVLTRRTGETLLIGKDNNSTNKEEDLLAKITVLGIRGNQVRIGIKAPNDVWVHREEVLNKICKDDPESEDLDNDSPL